MSADLVRFVEARIAEDEAAARHYSVRHWRNVDDYTVANDPGVAGFVKPDAEHGWGVARTATVRDAEFIARHDPARVLRQCEAFRRIVEAFEDERQRKDIYNRDYPLGLLTTEDDLRARQSSNARWAGLEIAVRNLASIWSDHPDYRQEWAA